MWFYVQMWFPLLTVALTASICFSVVSFIMGQPKVQRKCGFRVTVTRSDVADQIAERAAVISFRGWEQDLHRRERAT